MIGDVGAGLLAAIWLTAVATKLRDVGALERAIELTLDRRWSRLAPLVLASELALAFTLLVPDAALATVSLLVSAGVLIALSTFALVHASRAPGESCACFGPASTTSPAKHLAFNLSIAAITAALAVSSPPTSDLVARLVGLSVGFGLAMPLLVVRPMWNDLRRPVT